MYLVAMYLVLFFIVYFATLCTHLEIYYHSFKFLYLRFELYMCIEKYNLSTRGNARVFVLVVKKHHIKAM
jgi:hypothetical protein